MIDSIIITRGSVARMTQESSSKKRRVLCSETPDDQGKDRSDEVLLYCDEEAMDPMNMTTDSQFELDDQFMPSLNSIRSSIAPQPTIIAGHTAQLPTIIADHIITTADQTTIDVQFGTSEEKMMLDQPIINNEQTSLPTHRNRRPGPYNISPYLTNFGSSVGSLSS